MTRSLAQTARVLASVTREQEEADRRATAAWIAVDRLSLVADDVLAREWRAVEEIAERVAAMQARISAHRAAHYTAIAGELRGRA